MRVSLLLLALLALVAGGAGWARGVEPAFAAGDLDPRLAGYPELTIRLTKERIEAPAAVAAGRTLARLVQEDAEAEDGHAFVLRVPDDVSDADLDALLATGASAAQETPGWFWRALFVGNGDRAAYGRPAVALVDLVPGRYLAGDPFRPVSEYARFAVTGDAAETASAKIKADVVATMHEMAFDLPAAAPAGRQVWEVKNTGGMVHELAIVPVTADATEEQLAAAVAAELVVEFGGDPAEARRTVDALGAGWEGWSADLVAGVGVTSPGRSVVAQFDLKPGRYGVICFVPDPATGTPHLMMGMTGFFTVAASAA